MSEFWKATLDGPTPLQEEVVNRSFAVSVSYLAPFPNVRPFDWDVPFQSEMDRLQKAYTRVLIACPNSSHFSTFDDMNDNPWKKAQSILSDRDWSLLDFVTTLTGPMVNELAPPLPFKVHTPDGTTELTHSMQISDYVSEFTNSKSYLMA